MAEVILLGTARALPTLSQENTYMALVGPTQLVLIDCGGSPYRRLVQAGLDVKRLDTIVLTHAHPDHVYGLPALLMGLWLAGRRTPLGIYGAVETVELARTMFSLFQPELWPNMFELQYHGVKMEEGVRLLEGADFSITATPVQHMIPTLGLRVVHLHSGHILVYSADTEPGPGIRHLASKADLLIHEASGAERGHSTAEQAGSIAVEAGVGRLLLVHYDANETPPDVVERKARSTYRGWVHAANDLERFAW